MPDADDAERTPDGRYLIIGGRRWRASDPSIPAPLRQELVDELMAARRAVRAEEPTARARVQDAKVALGERGPQWWETLDDDARAIRVTAAIRALLRKRAPGSICPSDVARIVGGTQWRPLMGLVRATAFAMAGAGELVVTQRGEPVPEGTAGPLRLRLPPD